MVDRLENEINCCLKNKCYIAALTLTAMLPDICGRAEFPSETVGDRYKKWFQKYVTDVANLNMTSDIAYSLRCRLLHEANPSIYNEKCKVKKFAFIIKENGAAKTAEAAYMCTNQDKSITYLSYNIDLIYYCETVSALALNYYKSNKDKFNFEYRFINMPEETAKAFGMEENSIRIEL